MWCRATQACRCENRLPSCMPSDTMIFFYIYYFPGIFVFKSWMPFSSFDMVINRYRDHTGPVGYMSSVSVTGSHYSSH